jgi:hypothetical protein
MTSREKQSRLTEKCQDERYRDALGLRVRCSNGRTSPETNSKVIAEWGNCGVLDAEARSKVLPVAFTARMTAIEKMWL